MRIRYSERDRWVFTPETDDCPSELVGMICECGESARDIADDWDEWDSEHALCPACARERAARLAAEDEEVEA